jgi:hypothetical protein
MTDKGGTLLLQEGNLPLLLCDEGIDAGGLTVEEGGDGGLFRYSRDGNIQIGVFITTHILNSRLNIHI